MRWAGPPRRPEERWREEARRPDERSREEARALMSVPQDWAPYSSLEDAARVYLRDPELALDQLRTVVDFPAVRSFIMSRGATDEPWGDAVWQEVVLTDGRRLIIWRAED